MWARTTLGLSQGELARRLRVEPEAVRNWEVPDTASDLTYRQLTEIAHHLRRPAAALLLRRPPPPAPLPKDFRRPRGQTGAYSPEVRLAARRARRFQALASKLSPSLGEEEPPKLPAISQHSTTPEDAAGQVRANMEVPSDIHTTWRDPGGAIRGWRSIVESHDILVFSSPIPREEAQGFSISDRTPWVVVVSSKDSPAARCFTLWHELGHLLLRDGGLCATETPDDIASSAPLGPEDWCNRFAEAILVDGELLQQRAQTVVVCEGRAGHEAALRTLAGHFRVSQQVILYRLLHLGLLPLDRFRREYSRVEHEAARAQFTRRGAAFGQVRRNVAREAVQERGQKLSQVVLQALDRGELSRAEAADYLGARMKHLDNIRREAHR